MEVNSKIKDLYQAVLIDCKTLLEETLKERDESIKDSDTKKIINLHYSALNLCNVTGYKRTYLYEYLKTIDDFFDNKKTCDINENEIFSAYGYINCFRDSFKLSTTPNIKIFDCKNYPNFLKIINNFDDFDKIKENYEKSVKLIFDGNDEKKGIKNLYQILQKRKLVSSTVHNITKTEKKKKRKHKAKAQNNEIKHISINMNSIKNEDKELKNNSNDIKVTLEDKKELNLINDKDEGNKNIENLQNNPGADLTKNYENKGKKDIELNGEIIINSQSENNEVKNDESCISFDNINIDGENSISNNNKIKNKINLNNNIIEEDNNNKNKEVNNINNNKEGLEIKMDIINKELKDELNPESSINYINEKNNNILKDEDKNMDKKIGINDKDFDFNSKYDNNNIKDIDSKKVEVNFGESKKDKDNKSEEKQIDKISYENLVEIVFSMRKELKETKDDLSETNTKLTNKIIELDNTKTELSNTKTELTAKIDKLLVNQKLMYHQISMIQSRDISKSIYHFFADYLGVKYEKANKEEKPFYDLIKVIDFLNKNDNTMYSNVQKLKLKKFLKTLFFINKVHNKILHNNLSSDEIDTLNKMKYEDGELLPLIPILGYDQLFETLGFYIENNTKINQIQVAMKYIYNKHYKDDAELYSVKDETGEAIRLEGDKIKLILTKEEINDVKNIFSQIKDFKTLCSIKTWDKSKKKF